MAPSSFPRRTTAHKPRLAWFSAIGSVWVFILVLLGAFTTSIGAGMAFPDWPLSNGSMNPDGWLRNLAMFAEHSHRLSGMTMGLMTIGLVFWLWCVEERSWLRKLAWAALALVIVQGILGGLRVMLDRWNPGALPMSFGQLLRIPHGVLAQVFVCLMVAIAVACSRPWIDQPMPVSRALASFGRWCCVLLLVQLGIAATMRHSQAGLAVMQFPHATPEGGWLPDEWNFRVGIHMAHRFMALILGVALCVFARRLYEDPGSTRAMRVGAVMLVLLLTLQLFLGAQIIWRMREPLVTTGHVLVGALLMAHTFGLTWMAHRDIIQRERGFTP